MRMTGDYYLSMDIMQESFLRCLEKYRDKTLNISLLYTIARNILIDFYRREKRKTEMEEDAVDQKADVENEYQVKQEHRKGDGPPGTTTMWRGLIWLQTIAQGFAMCKTQMQRAGP